MNCDQTQEILMDLLYGELGEADARAAEEHLQTCTACRGDFQRLQLARAALAGGRADEPAGTPLRLGDGPGGWRGRIGLRRVVMASSAVAAVIVLAAMIWVFHETTPPVYGHWRPEIERQGVSLTILSTPEAGGGYVSVQAQAVQRRVPWRRAFRRRYAPWQGLALVRDQRIVRRLKPGVTQVRFADVPSGILPETVRLRGLDAPEGLRILEQNYQYDLASAGAVLKRYVDRPIGVTFKNGEALGGELLSFDERTLVIRPAGQGPRNVAREQVSALSFEELPEGLLSRPTLLWQLRNNADDEQRFEVAYLTEGLTWRADYVLKITPAAGGGRPGHSSDQAASDHAIVDTAELVGYATVTNNSGVTYAEAQLKLMAGDVNLIRQEVEQEEAQIPDGGGRMRFWYGRPQFTEKSFFEYHLYTLGRSTTLRSAETKQIELIGADGLKLKRGYVYDRKVNATAARVVSELKNSEENGLGKPLPKGVVRLYAPDPTGRQTFVAKTTIDHTPKDETIRLPWGYAFDVVCGYSLRDATHRGHEHHEKRRYTIRNHKDHGISVTVIARVPRTTYRGECNFPWHVRQVGLIEIDVAVKANAQAEAVLDIHYNDVSGGGLRSPHDEAAE